MAQRTTLTKRQIDVLRWIADGCPDGVMADDTHKISAAALRNRGLITTSGRGSSWTAATTPTGREYLKDVDGPNPPVPRQANVSVTAQLVQNIVDAGGSLRLPRRSWNDRDTPDYAQRARLAERHGKVPHGKRLRISSVSGTEFQIDLIDDPDVIAEAASKPVPVPARVSRPHRVAKQFRDRLALHEVSRKQIPRATRIIHALTTEAERRGYTVECASPGPAQPTGRRGTTASDGQIIVTISGHPGRVRIWEKGVTSRAAYEQGKREWERVRRDMHYGWQWVERPQPFDKDASGELNAAVSQHFERQTSWGDRKTIRLEDRLPRLLRELELQAHEAEQREIARQREIADRQAHWERAMANARQRYIDDRRLEILNRRVQAWRQGEEIRAYCRAVEDRYDATTLAENPSASSWLALARAQADRLQRLPTMPEDPKIRPEDLKPYLGGLSPYGPEHRTW